MITFNPGLSTDEISAGRLVAHGMLEATDLDTEFSLAGDIPFTIMIVPVANITANVISIPDAAGLLVSCQCAQDSSSSDLPVMFGIWTEGQIRSIDQDAIELDDYNVYVGIGGKS